MTADRIRAAAVELCAAVDAACAPSATEAEMVAALRGYGAALDRLDAAGVQLIAAMARAARSRNGPAERATVADLLGAAAAIEEITDDAWRKYGVPRPVAQDDSV